MATAVILSSHVAGSRVGGSAQALALGHFGIEAVHVPTVLYGRHPGWGAPGGGAVPADVFESVLEGVDDHGLLEATNFVITGYFASADQVVIAAEAAKACPNAVLVVDPIMGDAGRELYVPAEVAEAIERELVPLAHLLAPNAWEAARLAGLAIDGPPTALQAARAFGKPALISSVGCGEEIGVLYADPRGAWLAAHRRLEKAPNGAGDLLTALFAALLPEDIGPEERLARAVGGVALAVAAAEEWETPELPLAALGPRLKDEPAPVRVEKIA